MFPGSCVSVTGTEENTGKSIKKQQAVLKCCQSQMRRSHTVSLFHPQKLRIRPPNVHVCGVSERDHPFIAEYINKKGSCFESAKAACYQTYLSS